MFQVLATVFEPEGKDRAPNKESSVIQKARAIVRAASWSRGHDPNFSSAGTERDSIHHCEEHWLPSATQENYKEDWLRTQNIPHVLQQRIWLKKIMFYPPPEIQKSTIEVQPAYIKTLPGFCCSVSQSCLSITISQSLLKLIPLGCWCHPTIVCSVTPSAPAFNSSQYQVFFCLLVCFFPMSWLFPSGGQSIGLSASVLPVNIQGWFPLGLTGWISLQSKGCSRVFSTTTVQTDQFFSTQTSLWFSSSICI